MGKYNRSNYLDILLIVFFIGNMVRIKFPALEYIGLGYWLSALIIILTIFSNFITTHQEPEEVLFFRWKINVYEKALIKFIPYILLALVYDIYAHYYISVLFDFTFFCSFTSFILFKNFRRK